MPEGKPVPLEFPGKGIDVTREFQLQPPGTTPDALNVRTRDSIAQRNRGGSRPGLSKYIPQIIPEGAVLIQHLNFIVDPTVEALPQNFDTPEPDWIPDPRIPGVLVPPGGAPWQPNPNSPTKMTIGVTLQPLSGGVDVTLLTITLAGPTGGTATGVSHHDFINLDAGEYTLSVNSVGGTAAAATPTIGAAGGVAVGFDTINTIDLDEGENGSGYIFKIDNPGVGNIAGDFTTSDTSADVQVANGPSTPPAQPAGSFDFINLDPGTYDLVFGLHDFPPTRQIDYANIVVGSGGGTIVNLGSFNCEIDGIIVGAGDSFSGYVVPDKPFP